MKKSLFTLTCVGGSPRLATRATARQRRRTKTAPTACEYRVTRQVVQRSIPTTEYQTREQKVYRPQVTTEYQVVPADLSDAGDAVPIGAAPAELVEPVRAPVLDARAAAGDALGKRDRRPCRFRSRKRTGSRKRRRRRCR